jgi:hypothetical protein
MSSFPETRSRGKSPVKNDGPSHKIRRAKLNDRKALMGSAHPEVSFFFDKYHG